MMCLNLLMFLIFVIIGKQDNLNENYESILISQLSRNALFKFGSSGLLVGCALWDREVPGSILARGTAYFLEQEINPILLHFTQV